MRDPFEVTNRYWFGPQHHRDKDQAARDRYRGSAVVTMRNQASDHCTVTVPTIPGWMVHWYGNEPAAVNVLLNVAPGAMEPEFHVPLRPVDVWAVLSLFVHVTVPPTATVTGLGEYAFVVRVDAPLTIDTGVPDAPGDGDGDGVGVGVDGDE